VLVVSGRTGLPPGDANRYLRQGAVFVFPLFQTSGTLHAAPFEASAELDAQTSDGMGLRGQVRAQAALGDSNAELDLAAQGMLNADEKRLQEKVGGLLTAATRQAVAGLTGEEARRPGRVCEQVKAEVGRGLAVLGLRLIWLDFLELRATGASPARSAGS